MATYEQARQRRKEDDGQYLTSNEFFALYDGAMEELKERRLNFNASVWATMPMNIRLTEAVDWRQYVENRFHINNIVVDTLAFLIIDAS